MTTDSINSSDIPANGGSRWLAGLSFLALPLLTFVMFADVLVSTEKILSDGSQDIVMQGLPWREFGFSQWRAGNLPQWNPHIFLGMPFLGGMQSAMFYPPNWLYLIVPVGLATNWLIALHVCASGMFMQLWAARRGLHPLACVVAGALLMFCGPQFLRIRAGHLPPLFWRPWVVLMFLAIDEFFKAQRLAWCLVGMGAATLLILSGHPQYFFYAAVAGAIYAGLRLVDSPRWWLIAAGLIGMLAGAIPLAAVQLLPGFDATGESVRSAGVPYAFVAGYSFPPENLLTLAVPGFFGDHAHVSYWGRWNMWEGSLFIGATGLVLAVYGAIFGTPTVRRFSVTMVVILVVLALGGYTPLLPILYQYIPGFDKFRAAARFTFPAAMFLCLLAGIGLDRLLLNPLRTGRTAAIIGCLALLFTLSAAGVHQSVAGPEAAVWWQKWLSGIEASGQLGRAPQVYSQEALRQCGECAALGLLIAAGTWLVLAVLLGRARMRRQAVYGIAALAVVEMFAFAWLSRDTFLLSQAYSADLKQFLADHPGDYRIYNTLNPNAGMINGADDIWGYDSLMSLRYAELIAFTQGQKEDAIYTSAYPVYPMRAYHPIYKALRFRYLVSRAGDKIEVQEFPDVLPQLQLVQDYRVVENREDVLPALNDATFDPRRTVILERDPGIVVDRAAAADEVSLVDSSTDRLLIEAHISAPAILLVTDGWSKNWVARSADGTKEYQVMPADYVLRAIPLEAGDHLIELVYRSESYTIGKWISLAALLAYGSAVACVFVRGKSTSRAST